MQSIFQENLDWSKHKTVKPVNPQNIRRGNLSLLAMSQFKDGELVRSARPRCIWPNPYNNSSNILSRRVWSKGA